MRVALTFFALLAGNLACMTSVVSAKQKSSKKSKSSPKLLDEINAELSGAQEVPANNTVLSEGTARIQFDEDLATVAYDIEVFGGPNTRITQLHLHCGLAGVNGPIVALLMAPDSIGKVATGPFAAGTLTSANILAPLPNNTACGLAINNIASLFEAVLQRKIYVNVHSLENPGGELRGQLIVNLT